MARKGNGKEAKLSYNGNLLTENSNGLIVNMDLFQANGTAERDAALILLEEIPSTPCWRGWLQEVRMRPPGLWHCLLQQSVAYTEVIGVHISQDLFFCAPIFGVG